MFASSSFTADLLVGHAAQLWLHTVAHLQRGADPVLTAALTIFKRGLRRMFLQLRHVHQVYEQALASPLQHRAAATHERVNNSWRVGAKTVNHEMLLSPRRPSQ